MARLLYNFLHGTLGAGLTDTDTDTTITFSAPLSIPTIVSGDYVPLVLDPNGVPEIVHLIAYVAGATTGTIARGASVALVEGGNGATPVAHANADPWEHGPLVVDVGGGGGWMAHLNAADDNPLWVDEFDGTALDPAWAQVDSSGTTLWVPKRGILSARTFNQAASDANALLYPRALAVGETLETCVRVVSPLTNYIMFGLIVTDGVLTTSNCVWLMPFTSTTAGIYTWSLRHGTVTNVATTVSNLSISQSEFHFQRLTRVSADVYKAECSSDGIQWTDFGLAQATKAMTPSHIGVAVSVWSGGAVPRIASFEYLRVYAA